MRLKVLSIAYPAAPVTEDSAGGAEQVLSMLDRALVESGHESLVVACQGSQCRGKLIPIPPVFGPLNKAALCLARQECSRAIARALEQHGVDLIHYHGCDFLHYLHQAPVPALVSLHLPLAWYEPRVFAMQGCDVCTVCVSQLQARDCPTAAGAVIPNGIRVERFEFNPAPGAYAVGLGRICPEKGFHLAMDACSSSGTQLLLAGVIFDYPEHRRYFDQEISPRLQRGHRFLGHVGGETKHNLLRSARCLLAPSLVDETSSLVAMEAMACGTPVIAYPKGALRELIDHGRTGLLVNSVAEMAAAIAEVETIDRAECRREAERRFTSSAMARSYMDLYRKLAFPASADSARAAVQAA